MSTIKMVDKLIFEMFDSIDRTVLLLTRSEDIIKLKGYYVVGTRPQFFGYIFLIIYDY